jgi:hypothetical protein
MVSVYKCKKNESLSYLNFGFAKYLFGKEMKMPHNWWKFILEAPEGRFLFPFPRLNFD